MTRNRQGQTASDRFYELDKEVGEQLGRLNAALVARFRTTWTRGTPVNWNDVGSAAHFARELRELADCAEGVGEYAAPAGRTP